jgi:hypothetical protein
MKEIKFNLYNDVALKIMSEEATLKRIKIKFEDEISKSILKENTLSTLDWAKYAHKNNLWYPITIYKNNFPEVYISYGSEYVIVYFFNKRLFEIMSLTFKKTNDKLFLTKIYNRTYNDLASKPLQDLKEDKSILFTEDGNLTVTTNEIIRNETVKISEEVLKSTDKVNVSNNYINVPHFGEYDQLLDYTNILKPGDFDLPFINEDDKLKAKNKNDEQSTKDDKQNRSPDTFSVFDDCD